MGRIPIIIPAYEPDTNLLNLCGDLLDGGLNDILIINDGSGSEYSSIFDEIRNKYSIMVFEHIVNMGKGRSLKADLKF